MSKLPPKSKLQRAGKLLKTGLNLLGKEVKHRINAQFDEQRERLEQSLDQLRQEQLKKLTKTLGELKGSAMKAGQLLSLEGQDLIPDEWRDILSSLQNQAPSVDHQLMLNVLEKELGEKSRQIKATVPSLASASIGQVYRADWKGKDIVVKIQYPGIADTIDSDLKMLKNVLQAMMVVMRKKAVLEELFDEMSHILHLEVDYVRERENLVKYKKALNESDDRYVIPQVFPEISTRKVLSMSYERGQSIHEWLKGSPGVKEREHLALALVDLCYREFYENGLVQTDPNFANFLIRDSKQLVLLDFGACLEYSRPFIEDYRILLRAMHSRNKDKILGQAYRMEFLDPRESEECHEAFLEMMELSVGPFRSDWGTFHFADKEYSEQTRKVIFKFLRLCQFTPPPRRLIFLHRKIGGLFNLLKKMDVSVDLSLYLERIL